jgi:hypothetical protein
VGRNEKKEVQAKSRKRSSSSSNPLSPLASQPPGQLHILGLDGHPLGVNSTQVGILEQGDEVGFGSFLKGHDRRGLESEVGLEVLGDFY